MSVLHSSNYSSIPKDQEKAKKYFESLSKEEQQILVEKFEKEKITNDILKTIYKKEGIE